MRAGRIDDTADEGAATVETAIAGGIAGLALLVGSRSIIKAADPAPPRPRRREPSHLSPAAVEPEAATFAAAPPAEPLPPGLLDDIPFAPDPPPRRRVLGSLKLVTVVILVGALLALMLVGAGKAIAGWLSSLGELSQDASAR